MSLAPLFSAMAERAASVMLAAGMTLAPAPAPAPHDAAPLEGTVVTDQVVAASEAGAPGADQLTATAEAALADAPGTAHVSIRDLATGEELTQIADDEPVAPASSVKVLTAAAVLNELGPERRLRTWTVLADEHADGPAEVVLVGGGDALLGTGASDPDAVSGRAGLSTLAQRTVDGLQRRGVTGEVIVTVDPRLFGGDGRNPAWADDLYEQGHVSPVRPLATYGGREEYGTGQDRVEDTAGFAAECFQSALADAAEAADADVDVRVREQVPRTDADRAEVLDAPPLGLVESATVAEQVAFMLGHSDNQVAEVLARDAAHLAGEKPAPEGVCRVLVDAADRLRVNTRGLDLADASGLAGDNRVTADQLTGVLAAAARSPRLQPVVEALPAPGTDSTLQDRLVGTAAQDRVQAKTGTLLDSVSLTGRLRTASGREVVFSIVLTGIDADVTEAREAIDETVVALAEL
ncbi:D-alanyl-D-alanine carboxypeptidase/D-alanyl-D-alanine-endopeptidase [uncultured Micrococcus sp.]|uniref:D-alanyl-D-alanine carboxypeptidase/D-alanyl-D-alanine-endopeptidase n=1 Tax=uncultured Micrococcus sp. TaxID=114051 RepID=UPI0025971265|nr:D-alanyl-D-alanine carboxypeptidase [uncultured Micrococcus sp.]